MSNIIRIGTILLGFALITACAMPQTRIYSLHMPAESNRAQVRKQAVITLRVQSPRYLAQPYIAHRISPYELDISRYAKWDSAPVDMIREVFRDSLSDLYQNVRTSNYLAEGSYLLNISLNRLERVENSFAELAFDAQLYSAENRELYRIEVQKKVQIDPKDQAGLARGLSAALSEAVREVLAGLGSRI